MFSTVRLATESVRRTQKLSLPEQFSSLLKMEESSSGCSTTVSKTEVYPYCFPPPRSSVSRTVMRPEGASISQFRQGLGLPQPSFYQPQQSILDQPDSRGPGSLLQRGRPSTEFPYPPAAFSRSYHTSSQNNSSMNGSVSVQTETSREKSESKRTLNEGCVDSKKLRLESGGSTTDNQTSASQQQKRDEAVTSASSVSGDELDQLPRPDMSRFKRRWKTALVRDRCLRDSDTEVSVLSYNVLAQCLIESNGNLYDNCPWEVLRWDYRKWNLLKDLTQADADIMCLQEVQACHFYEFFLPELEKLGYLALYQKRTGDKHDGCTIFYKKDKFELEAFEKVKFYRGNVRLLDRDNVAIVSLLRIRGPPPETAPKLCVATTHLLYNPKRGDIKLTQLGVLLAEIDCMAAVSSSTPSAQSPAYHPIVLCGDFNSLPHSPLYDFIRNRRLDYVGLQKYMVSGQKSSRRSNDPLNCPLWPDTVGVTDTCQFLVVKEQLTNKENSFQEKQDHCLVHCHDGYVREVTTNQSRTNCTVDYIFFSRSTVVDERSPDGPSPRTMVGQLQLLEYLSLLTDREARDMGGLPNHALSSDHFSLQAKFLLTAPDE